MIITELAWAAGLFDGEGSSYIHIRKTHTLKGIKIHYYIGIAISMRNNSFPLKRFQRAVEIGIVGKPDCNGTSYWRVHKFEEVQAVMFKLWKFLCPDKKKQFIRRMEEYLRLRIEMGHVSYKELHERYAKYTN